ncbi:hypothetical protein RRG08_003109 [Elysia crispata]|uniref:Uncharacterized protein n=1 Tax=Elysia crispata TaxID=231223 RepID=A0AAE1B765_9GAST|nr:hypothetical protein RRG08_003109 [Elysia crispata]
MFTAPDANRDPFIFSDDAATGHWALGIGHWGVCWLTAAAAAWLPRSMPFVCVSAGWSPFKQEDPQLIFPWHEDMTILRPSSHVMKTRRSSAHLPMA